LLGCASFAAGIEPQAAVPVRPWTVLVYGAADNNADGPILGFLDSVRKAIDDDAGIDLLLFLDRSAQFSTDATLLGEDFTGARLYRLRKDSAERLSGGAQFPEIQLKGDVELDSADATNLKKFIAWGKAVSPAQRYGVMIYSHASGESMCPDDESHHDMGIAEVSAELGESESIDFLALELCNMGGIEIGYEWRPAKGRFGAEVLLAIPNAGPPLDWDRAFARIRSPGHASSAAAPFLDPARMSAQDFGRLVIREGQLGRAAAHGRGAAEEAAACYDLRAAPDVKRAVDTLSTVLSASNARTPFLKLREKGDDGVAMNYSGGGPYVDLYDLCQRAEACEGLTKAAQSAAHDALVAVDRFVLDSFGMDGYEGFESGRHGVFIVLPVDKPGRWKNFRWYTPLAGSGGAYGRWSFLDGGTPNDGQVQTWFELLDSWYDEADDKGGVNGYRW
jgi:clostripain